MAYPLSPQKAWAQKQHMMAFLEAIEQIVAGAATQDWAAIERASEIMGTQSAHRLAECRSEKLPRAWDQGLGHGLPMSRQHDWRRGQGA